MIMVSHRTTSVRHQKPVTQKDAIHFHRRHQSKSGGTWDHKFCVTRWSKQGLLESEIMVFAFVYMLVKSGTFKVCQVYP